MAVVFATSRVFKKKIRQTSIRNYIEIANFALGKGNTLGTVVISINSVPQALMHVYPIVLTFTAGDYKQRSVGILLLQLV